MGLAAAHFSTLWLSVCESLAAAFRSHPVTGSAFMYPTHAQQQHGLQLPYDARLAESSIASNQVAIRFVPMDETSILDLLVLEHDQGGHAFQIKTYDPGTICMVVLHSDKCLHCNVFRGEAEGVAWNATGLHVDVDDYSGPAGVLLIYVPMSYGLIKIIPYCQKPIHKFVVGIDKTTWQKVLRASPSIPQTAKWISSICTFINDLSTHRKFECVMCNSHCPSSVKKKPTSLLVLETCNR